MHRFQIRPAASDSSGDITSMVRRARADEMPACAPGWLHPDDVLLDMRIGYKRGVLQMLGQTLAQRCGRASSDIFWALMEREHLGCTALGFGVALPHARLAGLGATVGAFCRLREPIDYGAPDDRPVSFVVGLLLPEGRTQHHLDLLAALATRLSENTFREALHAAPDATAACRLLSGSRA